MLKEDSQATGRESFLLQIQVPQDRFGSGTTVDEWFRLPENNFATCTAKRLGSLERLTSSSSSALSRISLSSTPVNMTNEARLQQHPVLLYMTNRQQKQLNYRYLTLYHDYQVKDKFRVPTYHETEMRPLTLWSMMRPLMLRDNLWEMSLTLPFKPDYLCHLLLKHQPVRP